MGVRSGESSYEFLILDKGQDAVKLDKFLSETKVCGWDGKHFHGYTSWHIAYPDDDYDSDTDYPIEQITIDFPGCVLFGWREVRDDFSCYPEYWNSLVVNGKSYRTSAWFCDGYLTGLQFLEDRDPNNPKGIQDDLVIDFYRTYEAQNEVEKRQCEEQE